jgi:hypothetical protein
MRNPERSSSKSVEALIGNTIAEMRANDLFRWLRVPAPFIDCAVSRAYGDVRLRDARLLNSKGTSNGKEEEGEKSGEKERRGRFRPLFEAAHKVEKSALGCLRVAVSNAVRLPDSFANRGARATVESIPRRCCSL